MSIRHHTFPSPHLRGHHALNNVLCPRDPGALLSLGWCGEMRYQAVPKSQGLDPDKWRNARWVSMPKSDIEKLISERYGTSMIDYLFTQLERGHVIETAWGYLRQEPAKGDT